MFGAFGLSKEAVGGALHFFVLILALVFLLPVLVPIACLPCAVFALLIHSVRYRRLKMPNRSVVRLFIPLNPTSYLTLNKGRYFKGLFYYYGYLLFVSIPAILAVIVMGEIDIALPHAFLANLIGGFLEVASVWVMARIVFYPYAALLIASNKTPTRAMNRLVYWNVERSARTLLDACQSVHLIKAHPRNAQVSRAQRRAKADKAGDRFTTECSTGRALYLHSCVIRKQSADDRVFFGEVLRYLPWAKIAAETKTVPFKSSIREKMRTIFAAAGVPWDQESEYTDKEARAIDESRIVALVEAVEDAMERAQLITSSTSLSAHYEELLTQSLDSEIPRTWNAVDKNSKDLRQHLDNLKLDGLEDEIGRAGRDLEDHQRAKQAISEMRSLWAVRSA